MFKRAICCCLFLGVVLPARAADARATPYQAISVPVPQSTDPRFPRGSRVVDVNSHGDVLAADCRPNVYFDSADCKAVLWSRKKDSYRELFPTCPLGSCVQRVAEIPLMLNERGEVGGRTRVDVVLRSERTGLRSLGQVQPFSVYKPIVGFNERGDIAGLAFRSPGSVYQAFVASLERGIRYLAPAYSSLATDMNEKSEIVGTAEFTNGAQSHAFYWSARDGMIDIGALLPAPASSAIAINKQGLVLVTGGGSVFLWDEQHGVRKTFPLPAGCGAVALTRDGEVTGLCNVGGPGPATAWVWRKERGIRQMGTVGYEAWVEDRNEEGSFVGSLKVTPTSPRHAFVWTVEDGTVDLDAGMPSRASNAFAVSDNGVVGGLLGDGVSSAQATIWVPRGK
jgi:probable HAF family extracellular repeat protein